jgi:PIF1 helicase.
MMIVRLKILLFCNVRTENKERSEEDQMTYWLMQSSQYSDRELTNMIGWVNSQKGTFVVEGSQAPTNEFENVNSLNLQQKKAFDLVISHSQSDQSKQLLLLVIGKAGCGKSFLIDRVKYALGTKCQVSALFGIAAFNIKGKTLHYLLKLPIRGKRRHDLNGVPLAQVQELFQDITYLIIDEFSVISQKNWHGLIDVASRQLVKMKLLLEVLILF